MKSKAIIKLSNALSVSTIDFADNSMINCEFMYDHTDIMNLEEMIIKVSN